MVPKFLPHSALALVFHPTKCNDALIDAARLSITSDMLNFDMPPTPSIPLRILEEDERVDDLIRLAEDQKCFTI